MPIIHHLTIIVHSPVSNYSFSNPYAYEKEKRKKTNKRLQPCGTARRKGKLLIKTPTPLTPATQLVRRQRSSPPETVVVRRHRRPGGRPFGSRRHSWREYDNGPKSKSQPSIGPGRRSWYWWQSSRRPGPAGQAGWRMAIPGQRHRGGTATRLWSRGGLGKMAGDEWRVSPMFIYMDSN